MLNVDTSLEIPLRADNDGVIRIDKTRVTLDTVVGAFNDGATAEEIAQQYPTLQLGDIYLVIAYYLRHQAEVEAYLAQRREEADVIRKENKVRFDPRGIRERLIARQTATHRGYSPHRQM
jgi:uncharacterized protein (DUF433 family)